MAMAEVMKADGRSVHAGHHAGEGLRQKPGRPWAPILASAHQCVAGLADTDRKQPLSLLAFEARQLVNGEGGEGDCPSPIGLRRLEPQGRLGLLKAFHHMHDAPVEIDASPPESQYLASAHACGKSNQCRVVELMYPDGS